MFFSAGPKIALCPPVRSPKQRRLRGIWLGLLASLVLAACSHDFALMKLEDQLAGYGAAVRWGLYQRALDYLARVPEPVPDFRLLKNIKVTSYQPVFRKEETGEKKLRQTVEIRYVHLEHLVEKTLIDEQTWTYDEDRDRWRLESGLPAFDLR